MVFKNRYILFAIVCFREKYWETPAFRSLQTVAAQEEISIFIHDNTDIDGWNLNKNNTDEIQLIYHYDKTNPGISKAYNRIAEYAEKNDFDYILFLDQDTELPSGFLEEYRKVIQSGVDIAAPLVEENSKLFSPTKYQYYRTSRYESLDVQKIILNGNTCINSGLLIKTSFFHKVGGYDEKLRLDFCDHEFVKRASALTTFLYIIPIKLEQDFSTNTNSLRKALFRYQLYTKDILAFKKINNNDFLITLLVDIPHLLRLTIQYKSLSFIKQRFF